MVLVLKHGSRNMEGIYLKSPKNLSVNPQLNKHLWPSKRNGKFFFSIQTLTSVQYGTEVTFKEEHDGTRTVVGIY